MNAADQPPPGPAPAGAPPPFEVGGGLAVPVDIAAVDLRIDVDAGVRRAVGTCRVRFSTLWDGRPLLDLVPRPCWLALDGTALDPAALRLALPPAGGLPVRVLDQPLPAAASHELEVEYPLGGATVRFDGDGGVRLGFS